jgi:hypothetical protein
VGVERYVAVMCLSQGSQLCLKRSVLLRMEGCGNNYQEAGWNQELLSHHSSLLSSLTITALDFDLP